MAFTANAQLATPLPLSDPAGEGLSSARLDRLHDFIQHVIASNAYLGAVVLVSRNGRIVDWHTSGNRDLAKRSPMTKDTIFRIYSMTKTITSVAVLKLMEEGKLALDDPIAKFIPEFENAQVFVGGTADAPRLRPAKRKITVRHLLTHSGGFATHIEDGKEAAKLFNRIDLQTMPTLARYAEYVARQPLANEPGELFRYDGVSLGVASRLIEVVSGQPFDLYLQKSIFDPLKMIDTGFSVTKEKRSRVADMVSTTAEGRLTIATTNDSSNPGESLNPYPSGAGGLYSTAGDYLRFCQMLLNGGGLDGVSILGRKTVELMMMNHTADVKLPLGSLGNGEGFGLGGYVVTDVARRGRLGSLGQFGWSGAGSTYYTIDRKEGLVALLLMQHLPTGSARDPERISAKFYNMVYQALIDSKDVKHP